MRVAITGGTGFIGRRLAMFHLERGDRVRLLSRRQVTGFEGRTEVFRADLADPNADLRSFVEDNDVLYHCAGHLTDESHMHAVHVEGTRRLVEAATGRIGRWGPIEQCGGIWSPIRRGCQGRYTRDPARDLRNDKASERRLGGCRCRRSGL